MSIFSDYKDDESLLQNPQVSFGFYKNGNLDEIAKNLYSCLRKVRNKGYKSISVEKIPSRGLGKTINDRLIRASKY